MSSRERLSANLRRIRLSRELSQESLATDAKLSRSYVSELERGKHNPTLETLDDLARVLTVDVVDLLAIPTIDLVEPAPLKKGPRSGSIRGR
jgi:transcriptional regulator with XRE-family HTH domain